MCSDRFCSQDVCKELFVISCAEKRTQDDKCFSTIMDVKKSNMKKNIHIKPLFSHKNFWIYCPLDPVFHLIDPGTLKITQG